MFSLTNKTEQLSFVERVSEVGSVCHNNPRKFVELLKNNFELSLFIPSHFSNKYYSSATNTREYSLESILSALLVASFFHIPNTSTLVLILTFSPELCEFCKFSVGKVPDESVFSKFKIEFDKEIMSLFDNISLHVISLLQEFDHTLADNSPLKGLCDIMIYDTTGAKPRVKENNPKFVANEVKKQEYFNKSNPKDGFNAYAAAYANLPKFANANPDIRLDYANGHFGYFYKYGIVSNGFGVPLHLHFLDEQFYKSIPSFGTMQEQKYIYDNASLKPVLSSFLHKIKHNTFHTFLGDSELDSYANFEFLHANGFNKMLIPINPRNSKKHGIAEFRLNSDRVPTCSKTEEPFIADGIVRGKKRSLRLKFVCPKSKKLKGRWTCECQEKCRETNSTVTTYVYPKGDLRLFPGVQRSSDEWRNTYKIRTAVERSISSLKSNPPAAAPNTYNLASIRSNITLTAITKLINVILAFALEQPNLMLNLRDLKFAA